MPNDLTQLLQSDEQAQRYYESLPKYAQEAVNKHSSEITNADGLHLFAETFMQDDSFRGA